MSITMKLRYLHGIGAGLAQEAMGRARAVSPRAKARPNASLGLRVEAATKAGLPLEAMTKPKRRPSKQRK
jgi:hypothetical protein